MRCALVLVRMLLIDSHGHLLAPNFRRAMAVGPSTHSYYTYYPFENYQPITVNSHRFRRNSFRCKDKAPELPITTTWTAGTSVTVSWDLQANHPGDCSLYISYDTNKVAPQSWLKIKDVIGCVSDGVDPHQTKTPSLGVNSHTVALPAWLPSCTHCVFRWEWVAVHQRFSSLQQYVDCAEVTIIGTSEPVNEMLQRVSPLILISGADHLRGNGHLRNPYHPFEVGLEYIAGGQALPGRSQAVAQYSGPIPYNSRSPSPSPVPPPLPSMRSPPSLPPSQSPACPVATSSCALRTEHDGRHCVCQYFWTPLCGDEPAGATLFCA